MSATPVSPRQCTAFVRQTRLLRATRQAAWNAWTQSDIVKTWWGPAGNTCVLAKLDVREGGTIRITDRFPPEGAPPPGIPREVTIEGVYTEVTPLARLQFTMKASWNPDEASLVTITFGDAEGGTEMTVLHERVPREYAHLYDAGWAETLDKFTAQVEGL